jgi:hypothetical protein
MVYCLHCEKPIVQGHTLPKDEAERIANQHHTTHLSGVYNPPRNHAAIVLEETYRKGKL